MAGVLGESDSHPWRAEGFSQGQFAPWGHWQRLGIDIMPGWFSCHHQEGTGQCPAVLGHPHIT